MQFLADENFPGPVVRALRSLGHDVAYAKESMRGAADRDVLDAAQNPPRVLVTFDKDFGELAFRASLPAHGGVILFRLGGSTPTADNERALHVITSRTDWPGHFAVVTDARVRMRRLPPRPSTR
jgi:predicted nuclease of predicted toxin-antitoxin system